MNKYVARVVPPPGRGYSWDRPYSFQHDFDGSADLATTVVHAIADVTGIDPTEAEGRLYDHVEPDALNRLFEPKSDGTPRLQGHLAFAVRGHQVSVYNTGRITIVPLQAGYGPAATGAG